MELNKKCYYLILIFFILLSAGAIYNLSLRPGIPVPLEQTPHGIRFSLSSPKIPVPESDNSIAAIDNFVVNKLHHVDEIVDRRKIGEEIAIRLSRGQVIHLKLVARNDKLFLSITLILTVLFFLISIFVWHHSRSPGERYFSFTSLFFAFIMAQGWPGIQLPFMVSSLMIIVYFFSYPLAFTFFLFFSLHFPESTASLAKINLQRRIFQIAGVSCSLALIILYYRKFYNSSPDNINQYFEFYRFFRLFIIFTLFYALVTIIKNHHYAPSLINRLKVQWVIWGVLWGAFPFIFLWTLPQVFHIEPLIPEWVYMLFFMITPLSIAIAIVRHRLFDIEIVLSRSLVYTTVLISMIAVYISIVGVISFVLDQSIFQHTSPLVSLASAITVALLFNPIKNHVQHFIDYKFFRIRYDRFQILQEFMQQLENVSDKGEILVLLNSYYQRVIPVKEALVFSKDTQQTTSGKAGLMYSDPTVNWLESFHGDLNDHELWVNSRHPDRIEPQLSLPQKELPACWIIMFSIGKHAWWLLGEKRAENRFWKEDIDLANQMVQGARLQLDKLGYLELSIKESLEKTQAQKMADWKELLLSEVAHDLRAPLNTILWKIKNLQPNIVPGKTAASQPVQGIQEHIFRLQRFIEGLLIFSHYKHGKETLRREPVYLYQEIQQVLDNLQGIIQEKKLKLILHCPGEIRLISEPLLLQEILLNLIQNAAKYSPELAIIRIQAESKKNQVEIRIEDEAGGIPENQLKTIFNPFQKTKKIKNIQQGFHLGLYIVQEFTKILQGKIKIESRTGKGTIVMLKFPLDAKISIK